MAGTVTPPQRWAVVGSRDYPDLEAVRAFTRSLSPGSTVISGGAKGVDRTAEWTAHDCRLEWISYRPREVPTSERQPGQE